MVANSILFAIHRPDFVLHVDGYDKLNPFAFPIHGCIDGVVVNLHFILWDWL